MSFVSRLGALTRELVQELAPPSVQVRCSLLVEMRHMMAVDSNMTK